MPKPDKKLQPAEARIAFLADRLARLMVDVVHVQMEYGPICFDEFYSDEYADSVRKSKEFRVCLDFVRNMLRRHDDGMGTD